MNKVKNWFQERRQQRESETEKEEEEEGVVEIAF